MCYDQREQVGIDEKIFQPFLKGENKGNRAYVSKDLAQAFVTEREC